MVFVATLTPAHSHHSPFPSVPAPIPPVQTPATCIPRRSRTFSYPLHQDALPATTTPATTVTTTTTTTASKRPTAKRTRSKPTPHFDHPWWKATQLTTVEEIIEPDPSRSHSHHPARRHSAGQVLHMDSVFPGAKTSKTISEPLAPRWKRPSISDAFPTTAPAAETKAAPTTECVGPYVVLKTLGSGAFSHVKLAVHSRDGKRVAIKMLEKHTPNSLHSPHQASNEASIIASLHHPHIVRLLDTIETPSHNCLILEYVPGGELYDLIADHPNMLTEDTIRRIFRDLVQAVKYLHINNVCHRDLKIENVLLDSSQNIKLTDFGLAKRFNPHIPLTTRCGSEEYAAPELVQAQPYDGRKTDIWALGIILFALLTGELPFSVRPGERPRGMFHRIARGDFKFPNSPGVSDSAKDLVKRILTPNPKRRATLDEILRHPWMAEKEVAKTGLLER
ncbi:hypothetical protein SpCBS45565_g00231 [Spizellomyces sp. 'palustris']|nr:hypothetical protein SpCBS45565_g00231 [Spizellomyces sp. 'palustris']